MEIGSDEWSHLLIAGARALGLELTQAHTRVFACHASELLAWNRVTNLTTVTDPWPMALTHYLDSLAPAGFIPENAVLLDIGSGGGFPGIPLHIALTGLRTTLIDASRKKVSFLRYVIRELRLERIEALHTRAEELAGRRGQLGRYDVIVSRALSAIEPYVRMAVPLLGADGRIIALKGGVPAEEVEALRLAAGNGSLGAALSLRRHAYTIPDRTSERSIFILERDR
ncbi:MAG: 16S rRNA (guanine(527)-N(7))-methyltransferase RsmG [Deltaproteobacteria bacterium]|nr:16S rRNA (guanine(527)-N(7))-methyltransferase RsmG [Deltaproteobacteria bacterium]